MIRDARSGRPLIARPALAFFLLVTAPMCAASFGAAALGTSGAAGAQSAADKELEAAVAKAQSLVEQVRKFPFPGRVDVSILPEKELARMLETKLTEDLPVPFGTYAACLAAVGLIDPVPDLEARLQRLYARQVAGFYDPAEKRFYLVPERMSGMDVLNNDGVTDPLGLADLLREALLTHELTHALQDRRLDLYPRMKALRTNTDALLALQAMLEGEATVVMSEALLSRLPDEARKVLGGARSFANLLSNLGGLSPADVEGSEGVPEYFIKELLFPYTAGATWIQGRKKGGWAGVEDAYKRLPETTSEILHGKPRPRVRLSEREMPKASELAGSTALFSDTLGEWVLGVLLDRAGCEEPAALAAEWHDDRVLYHRREDGEVGILWRIRLASPQAARRLGNALAPLFASRPVEVRPVISVNGSRVQLRTPRIPTRTPAPPAPPAPRTAS